MINPCPKHVFCPTGTGTDSPGVNYSAEHIDVPTFDGGPYYPTTPYGYHTACQGRCISLISQQDADLCALRQGTICYNDDHNGGGGGPNHDVPKELFGNDLQTCTIPGTGRLVVIPADVFLAESKAEANAQALSYINKLQINPDTPPGTTVIPDPNPTPTPGPVPIPGPIPTPTVPKKKPKPPLTSQCKPCDDTIGVDTFVIAGNIPPGTLTQAFESAPLKCGIWKFEVTGSIAAGQQCFISMGLVANDAGRTPISWANFFDCPQPAWICPCGSGITCSPQTTQQFGFFPGCCDQTSVTCKYAGCSQQADGNFLMRVQVFYSCPFADGTTPARNFTFTGTWLGPIPT